VHLKDNYRKKGPPASSSAFILQPFVVGTSATELIARKDSSPKSSTMCRVNQTLKSANKHKSTD